MSCNAKKDPNGTWRIQYRWTDWTGTKKKSQKRGFKTKKEAEEWYAHFMLQQSSDPTMTLADFWEIYKADMEKRLRKTTMKQKEYVMNDKVLPYFGKTPINEITAPMIRKWQGEMMDKGFKPTYLKTIHNQLSAILNYAVNFYDLRSNPCRKAGSMGKSKADERPYWTLEEFQKFSDAIMDKQDSWMAFQILFWTGMRIGELLALTPADFDFQACTIRINKSYQRLEGKDIITDPKTVKSNRMITMPEFLSEELESYIGMLYGLNENDRIFQISKSYLHHEMDRGVKLSGVRRIRIHDENINLFHAVSEKEYGTIRFTGISGAERKREQNINEFYVENTFSYYGKEIEKLYNCGLEEIETIRLENFFDFGNKIVLIGGAGLGKSTTLNYLYCNYERMYEAYAVKIKIDLKEYAKEIGEKKKGLLWCITNEFSKRSKYVKLSFDEIQSVLSDYLDNGKCLVILDALDEIPTLAIRNKVRDEIAIFCGLYYLNRFIISTREAGYLRNRFDETFLHIKINQFSDYQIRKYSEN